MKLTRLSGLLAVAILTAGSITAYAAGIFQGYPIVGGASYCAGTSTGATGSQVCNTTVPAGPSVMTGSELIPADTGLAGGAQPQTVMLTPASLNALPTKYSSALTAVTATNTLTIDSTTGAFIVNGNASLSPTTINLPTAPIDGQQLRLSSNATIATLTLVPGTGKSIQNTPTALTVSTTAAYGYTLIFRASANQWYRLL